MPVAKRGGLDPHLPFAIMTAESAVTPHVTSPAGARGLMQLMPALAQQLHASRFPGQPFHPDTLYQPGYNATLGTLELVGLADRLGDVRPGQRLPLVIAGYNGGEEAVRRWLASDPTVSLDVWTENVGYTETRRYVKRVLGYLMKYRRTYGDPPA
jgi:soluble lytic murein transglycosylase